MVKSRTESAAEVPVAEGHLSTRIQLNEVFAAGLRLEASAFGLEARNAVNVLKASGHPLLPLYGKKGFCQEAHNAFRFRRIYVQAEYGVPFLSSSDIISMRPERNRYISRKLSKNLDQLIVKKWDVLISCSGTIGNVSLAGEMLSGQALSQDAIRLRSDNEDNAGFVSAFLRSRFGRLQLLGASYGSVVVHIEPSHLEHILIPMLHPIRIVGIGTLMREACNLRDEANRLIDEADTLLHERLAIPKVADLDKSKVHHNRIRAWNWQERLDASYHDWLAETAAKRLTQSSCEITTLSDSRIAKEIRPITKFRKRVYVPHGGIPLLGGKQLFQIDPVDVKGLAKGAHTKDLPEIALETNMVLVTCSGTIGRTQIIPAYMAGWTANQHATRFIAADEMNPGYLYAWLSSDYGRKLVTRQAYGSVILEVDKGMFGAVAIPIPEKAIRNEIGDLVLKANEYRDLAWRKERDAIAQVEALIG